MTVIRFHAVKAGKPVGAELALAAGIAGLCFTAVSIYWGAGGTALLNTVGGSLERGGRDGNIGVVLMLWVAVVLKLVAAILPLVAVYRRPGSRRQRLVRGLAWAAGVVLFTYGLVLTSVGLLVQLGVVAASATADHRALAWHAFLWDPWFLLWGILVLGALIAARPYLRTEVLTVASRDCQSNQEIILTEHGRPIARLSPVSADVDRRRRSDHR